MIKSIKVNNEYIFDFFSDNGVTHITDYSRLDKKITWFKDNDTKILYRENNRKKITSIDELKNAFKELILISIKILCQHDESALYAPSYYTDFSYLNSELLINQLVFDILFDKYLHEAEKITRYNYAQNMSKLLSGDKYYYCDAINKELERGMRKEYNKIKEPKHKQEIEWLGVDADKYINFYNPKIKNNLTKNKPIYKWDSLYINNSHNINSNIKRGTILNKQYSRKLTRNNRNYSYEEIIEDFNEYNNFINKLLPIENESVHKYFNMSMRYYALESYKHIDFIFKFVNFMSNIGITEIDKQHFLIKRFTPQVLVPYIKNNEVKCSYNTKYYRPLLLVEEALKKEMQDNKGLFGYDFCADILSKYQYVRAKTYELFKYHMEYISSDYNDIKKFISESYNMRSYHESNEVWKVIDGKKWNNMDIETQRQLKKIIQKFISVNDALFGK